MASQSTSPYKPSPLSHGSPRTSPFKHSQLPHAQSPSTVRNGSLQSTPTRSPDKNARLGSPASVVFSPRTPPQPVFRPAAPAANTTTSSSDPLSRLPPAQLHAMRESFHLLASTSAGAITRSDVADMLTQLGQDASPAAVNAYFPAGAPSTLSLAAYLQTLAGLVGPLSAPEELGAAFAAFDVDDSGQVDMGELREALLAVPGTEGTEKLTEREIGMVMDGFGGRRALAKGMGAEAGRRGEVFRYQEFMAAVMGGGKGAQEGEALGIVA